MLGAAGVAAALLFAAAICHAGIAARPDGTPALNGLPLRPASDAVASVPLLLLTDAALGPSVVGEALLGGAALLGVEEAA